MFYAVLQRRGQIRRLRLIEHERVERAEVRFNEEHNPRIVDKEICEVVMTGHGRVVRARAAAPEALAAVDRVVEVRAAEVDQLRAAHLAGIQADRPAPPRPAPSRRRCRNLARSGST